MTEPKSTKPYPEVAAQANCPAIEAEMLAKWQSEGTFRRSVEARAAGTNGKNEYVFYDGPPFANGLPHYGHLLTGFVKDVVPRYQTMRGRRVERRFGWDCHGLPAEMEAEKELKISGREAITAFGIDKYNDACKKSVQKYAGEWRTYVTRQARWVDFDHDYKTAASAADRYPAASLGQVGQRALRRQAPGRWRWRKPDPRRAPADGRGARGEDPGIARAREGSKAAGFGRGDALPRVAGVEWVSSDRSLGTSSVPANTMRAVAWAAVGPCRSGGG